MLGGKDNPFAVKMLKNARTVSASSAASATSSGRPSCVHSTGYPTPCDDWRPLWMKPQPSRLPDLGGKAGRRSSDLGGNSWGPGSWPSLARLAAMEGLTGHVGSGEASAPKHRGRVASPGAQISPGWRGLALLVRASLAVASLWLKDKVQVHFGYDTETP